LRAEFRGTGMHSWKELNKDNGIPGPYKYMEVKVGVG
jgi:hypothetical protein